jgi:hypothetical protein
MSSLLSSLSNNEVIEKISNDTGDFAVKLMTYKDKVVNDFTRYNVDLNQSIAKIAQSDGLNDNQISRIIEEANNQVYLIKYAQMRNFPEREVIFDLAALPAVKSIVKNGIPKVAQVIEKRASWESQGSDDGLNFLNYTSHEMGSCAPEKKINLKEKIAEKLAKEINQLDSDLSTAIQKVADDIYTVAEALIKYDRGFKDSQSIFNKMCKEAQVTKGEQVLYKKALEQKIAQLKEVRVLPENYSLELSLSDMNEKDKFSLGKYSMIKTALHADEQPIITDNGKMIKSVSDIVNMAKNIKKNREVVLSLNDKKKKVESLKGVTPNAG